MMTEYIPHVTPKPEDIGALYDIGVFERIDGKLKCDFGLLLLNPVMRSYLLSLIATNINKHKASNTNCSISTSNEAIAFTSIIADTLKMCMCDGSIYRFVLIDDEVDDVVDIDTIGVVTFVFSFIGDTSFALFNRKQVLDYKFIHHHFIARKLAFIRERKKCKSIIDLRGRSINNIITVMTKEKHRDEISKIPAILIDPVSLMQMSSARMTFEQFIIKLKAITEQLDIMIIADINARTADTIASPHATSSISVISYAHMATVDLSIGEVAVGKLVDNLTARCLQGRIALLGNMHSCVLTTDTIESKKINIIEKNKRMFAGAFTDTYITSPGVLTISHQRLNSDNFLLVGSQTYESN